MEETGIIRIIDDFGRIILPRQMKRRLGLKNGTPIELFVSKDEIILKKYYPEKKIMEVVQELIESIEEQGVDLEAGISQELRGKAQEIQKLLLRAKNNRDYNGRYECPVCKNEKIKLGQRYCQICGTLIDLQANK